MLWSASWSALPLWHLGESLFLFCVTAYVTCVHIQGVDGRSSCNPKSRSLTACGMCSCCCQSRSMLRCASAMLCCAFAVLCCAVLCCAVLCCAVLGWAELSFSGATLLLLLLSLLCNRHRCKQNHHYINSACGMQTRAPIVRACRVCWSSWHMSPFTTATCGGLFCRSPCWATTLMPRPPCAVSCRGSCCAEPGPMSVHTPLLHCPFYSSTLSIFYPKDVSKATSKQLGCWFDLCTCPFEGKAFPSSFAGLSDLWA